jgi:hypothetical protein
MPRTSIFDMPVATSSRKWVEFFSTILGALIVAYMFPDMSGVLLLVGTTALLFITPTDAMELSIETERKGALREIPVVADTAP